MKRRAAEPLPELLRRNRNAATVYTALVILAEGKRQVNGTRARIAKQCGLAVRTIGMAVEALHEAHWIHRAYGRRGPRTWYRISLRENGLFAVVAKTTHRGARKTHPPVVRKATHSAASGVSKNDTQRASRCGTKNDTPLLEKRGAVPAAAPGVATAPAQNADEHPSARIEREKLAAIRRARNEQSERSTSKCCTESDA